MRNDEVKETPEEALARIQSMGFGKNDALVIMAFSDAGIDAEEIDPRHNVLTFNAWKGAGRRVAKGAISQKVVVWIPKRGKGGEQTTEAEGDDKKTSGGMWPKTTSLFHISQTVPADADRGTRPDAWDNPKLVREGTYNNGPTCAELQGQVEEVQTVKDGRVIRTYEYPDNQPEEPGVASVEVFDLNEAGDLVKVNDSDDFGKAGDDRPASCSCPMVGVVTNVDCPLHGDRALSAAG